MCLILPVPVVFLLMAFWLQLTADRQELVNGRGERCQVRKPYEGTSKEHLLAIHKLEGVNTGLQLTFANPCCWVST